MRLEPIPQRFNPVIQLYKTDVEGQMDFEFITPSGQFWNNLSEKDRGDLREVMAHYGKDLEDSLRQMRAMFPRNHMR